MTPFGWLQAKRLGLVEGTVVSGIQREYILSRMRSQEGFSRLLFKGFGKNFNQKLRVTDPQRGTYGRPERPPPGPTSSNAIEGPVLYSMCEDRQGTITSCTRDF